MLRLAPSSTWLQAERCCGWHGVERFDWRVCRYTRQNSLSTDTEWQSFRKVAEINDLQKAQRTFLDWLHDFDCVDGSNALLAMLVDCDDRVPDDYCESLGLGVGGTFGLAVGVIGGRWGLDSR